MIWGGWSRWEGNDPDLSFLSHVADWVAFVSDLA
jgi:hypothetical protein